MEALFTRCLTFTLSEEGGFVDNPDDPGGATNKGITLATLRGYLKAPNASVSVLRSIDDVSVGKIYRTRYWAPMQCGVMPAGVDLMVFDHGVNAGDGRSMHRLQRVLGIDQDGRVGPITLAAIAAWKPALLITSLNLAQEAYYRTREDFPEFGHGWLARLARRDKLAMQLALAPPPVSTAIAA